MNRLGMVVAQNFQTLLGKVTEWIGWGGIVQVRVEQGGKFAEYCTLSLSLSVTHSITIVLLERA